MDSKSVAMETAAGSARSDRGATILIVEDSPVQAELLRRALEGAGYQVIVAGDGAEGLAMAKANHPAAVVSDINMPVMDGYAMCQAIRREAALKTTPVILLTMLSDVEDVIHGLNAGADAYLTKPYNIPALVARLASLLAYPLVQPPAAERRTLKVRLGGEIRVVDAHGPRMLNLLISTYENAVQQNRELAATQQALEDLNQHLERKVLEKTAELRDSEEKFGRIAASAQDALIIMDDEGRIAYWNLAAEKIFGYCGQDALGTDLHALLAPVRYHDDYRKGFDCFRCTGEGPVVGKTIELTAVRKSGEEFPIELSLSTVKLANKWHAIGITRDITERRRTEEALRKSEKNLKEAQRVAQIGSWDWDAATDTITWSEEYYHIYGFDPTQRAPGYKEHLTTYTPGSAAQLDAAVERSMQTGEAYELDLELARTEGPRRWITARGETKRNAQGQITGLSGTAQDITERKRTEEDLVRLNWALRALGQSNSALVHAGTEKELFQTCCDAIASPEGYPLAWIGLAVDDQSRSVEIAAAAGEAVEYMEGFEVSWGNNPLGGGPTGTAIRTGATQVINNLAESDAYLPWIEGARANGLASSIAMPIRANGSVMGVLTIYGREVNAFNRPEVDLFEELAADIGYGIASRRTLSERDQLQQKQLLGVERLKSALIGTVGAVALTVEKRDPYTAGHQQRVAELCVAIGRKLDLTEDRLEGLRLGATIHDIGKIYVPAEILNRPGKLTAPEFEIIRSHPQVGYDILKDVKFPWPVKEMILQHHERLDGSGYPQGLKGDAIIIEARILAVADVIEAMSSHRPYRAGLGLDAALAQVRQEAGTRLDPQVVDACERVFHEDGFSFAKA